MTLVFSDQSTKQGLVEHLKFITGQDSLSANDATRLLNMALDDYSYIALTSSGRWKFDDLTHVNEDGDETFPIATATLNADEESVPLETDLLMINQVQIQIDGKWQVLEPVDTRDSKHEVLSTTYSVNGKPIKYDYDAHSLFFYPKSDTARSVRVLYSRPSPYFSVTDTGAPIGIPRIHHEYLVLHAANRLNLRTNDSNSVKIKQELLEFEQKIRDFYSKRDQDTPRRLKAKINVPR